MNFRKIHIDDRTFDYHIGRQHILIRENGKKLGAPTLPDVTGWTWDAIERAIWKQSGNFHITPAQIRNYIITNYLNTT